MLENFVREYNVNRVLLSRIGLWPFQNKIVRNLLPALCFLLEISYYSFEILTLHDHWDNVRMICESSYQIVLSTSFIARILNELRNRTKLRRLYETINNHWNIFTDDMEIQILKDYSFMSQMFTKCYSTSMYTLMSGFIIVPLTPVFLDIISPLNESRPRFLALEVEFRVDKNEYFIPIFCYTTAIIVVGISIMVSVDAMHITCTAHACSLFAVVSYQIENIILKVNNNNKMYKYDRRTNTKVEISREEMLYREYIKCLKKHQLAIEFVDLLKSSYEGLALFLLILVIATLSLIGLRIVYVLGQFEEMARFLFIIIGALMNLMISCYSGQRLMDESQNIFDRAYATEWYNFSPRIKSLLIITLYRSSVPCILKAGNMVPLSVTTYASVSILYKVQSCKPISSFDKKYYIYVIMLENFLREYNVNRILLSLVGLWPFQHKLIRNLLRSSCLLIEISYIWFEILLLYDHMNDSQLIFEALYQFVITFSFLIRIANEIQNHDKLRLLYETIDDHWNIFTNNMEVQVLSEYSTISRKFAKYYSALMYLMMSTFIILPLTPVFLDVVSPLNESRPRTFALEVEFRVDKNEYFLPIFCYTTAIIVVGISIMVGVDAMHITCTAHACSLFAAISEQIENISKVNDNNKFNKYECHENMKFESSREKIIYEEYIKCLKKHQLAIEFVDRLRSSYEGLALFMLITVTATLSLIGIRIIYVLNEIKEIARYLFIIIGTLINHMISCYSGQKLMDESQNIFYRAYAAEWYYFSPRIKSLMMIILYRSNVPCKIKAGNMVPLSIATYAAI
ncbi:uncharacterized protein [Linepithema humile]|uniref:uncharacterized protein n=1 Tax=Linepithema humile TaxID=83485 RepID=UPI00351F2EBA